MNRFCGLIVRLIAMLFLGFTTSFSHDPEVTIITQPVLTAQVGQLYEYDVDAVSEDSPAVITFRLKKKPAGMTIDRMTGLIQWVPARTGLFRVRIRAEIDDRDRIELEADLIPTNADPFASGEAKFEKRDDRTRFEVEVEDVSSIGELDVRANGSSVGSITVDENGDGQLELDTRNGDTVPDLEAGDVVEVFNAVGDLILSGTLEVDGNSRGGGHDDQEYMLRVFNSTPGMLQGVVRNQAGLGIGDVRVRMFEISSGHFVFRTRSDSSGHYAISDVDPGVYLLRIVPPENSIYARQWYDRVSRIQDATRVVIPESTTVTINITLLPRDTILFTLSGNVSDTADTPIPRAKVFIFRARHDDDLDPTGFNFEGLDDEDRRRHLFRVVTTDSMGNYHARLRPRNYILAAFKKGFEAQFISMESTQVAYNCRLTRH